MKIKCHFCGVKFKEKWSAVLIVAIFNWLYEDNKLYPICDPCNRKKLIASCESKFD